MIHLIYIEWLKLRKYTTFWVLVGLFAFLFMAWSYGVSNSFINIGGSSGSLLSGSFTFPDIWDNLGYIYSWFVVFLCVLIIISISNEFAFRTGRQHIIDGMERMEFLHAKSMLILLLSFIATLFFALTTLTMGLMKGGTQPFDHAIKILHVFLYTLNYVSFAALISFFIKRSGLSIMLLLAYFLFESIVSGIINWKFDTYLGNLLFLQCSDELLPLQVMKTLSSLGQSKPEAPESLLMLFSVIYVGLYYFIVRRKLMHSDL
jgi:hypothetical protein